jgi:hypothetical protein
VKGDNLILAKLADFSGGQQGDGLFTQRLTGFLPVAKRLGVGVPGTPA